MITEITKIQPSQSFVIKDHYKNLQGFMVAAKQKKDRVNTELMK